ncbi:sperm motility kinase Y-like [Planoprotostelium fungivorum]|uniref:Sperm motility kinase Y-like n=1 Tax=Planoprotostelium fungivorum TaxID=1890364 RepID=A0A2P6NXW6_9EUKA|nr:sperm motility kinase Y-like [Planoprotostelium fungivorum]
MIDHASFSVTPCFCVGAGSNSDETCEYLLYISNNFRLSLLNSLNVSPKPSRYIPHPFSTCGDTGPTEKSIEWPQQLSFSPSSTATSSKTSKNENRATGTYGGAIRSDLDGKRPLWRSTQIPTKPIHSYRALQMNSSVSKRGHQCLAKLGEGSFGSVLLGFIEETGEEVAIKRLNHRAKNIEREICANKIIKGISGVCPYRYLFKTDHVTELVFDVVEGQDLFDIMANRKFKPLPEVQVQRFMSSIALTLSRCHQRGVAHRDIKLENIMIDAEDRPILIDWGLSTFFTYTEGKESTSKELCGSIEYIAPEFLFNKEVQGTKADAWALGVTAFCLLFGEFPYGTDEVQQLFRRYESIPLPPDNKNFTVSKEMRRKLSQLLTINPTLRSSVNVFFD